MPMTKPTSEQVTFLASGTGASQRTVLDKLRDVVSVKDFGAVGDGVTDDTAAIAAAIASSEEVQFPPGDYRVTAPIPITNKVISLYSHSSDHSESWPVRILCYEVSGTLFPLSGASTRFSVDGIQFDGRLNGTGTFADASTTWTGLISAAAPGVSCVIIANCQVSYSRVADAAALDLQRMIWVDVRNTRLSFFGFGYGMRSGSVGLTDTTVSFYKVYMNYNRQCARIDPQTTDVQFRSCVFESSVVAASVYLSTVLFSGCYFENIGYDITGTGISTGLIPKTFGINFSPNPPAGDIASAINLCYARCTFMSCTFAYRNAAQIALQPNAGWLYMVGRGSAIGGGAGGRFDNCYLATTQSVDFCEVDANAGQNFNSIDGVSFSWNNNSRVALLRYGDVRRLRDSSLYITFPSTGSNPTFATHCHVINGRIILQQPSFTEPSNSPSGGQWEVGDTITFANPATQGFVGSVCVVAGTPGTWRAFGEVLSAPTVKTADFSLASSERIVIADKSGSACVVTLPSAASSTGRKITFKTIQAQALNSASANVVPITGGAAGTQILANTSGKWADIVSDGTNWIIIAAN